MKNSLGIRLAALAALLLGGFAAEADEIASLPLTEHEGRSYHYLQVQPKETVYSLTRRLGITLDELVRYNPQVADGLKAYDILYFPAEGAELPAQTLEYVVQPKETVYGLSKRFGLTPDELVEQNPEARDGLKAGQKLTLRLKKPLDERWAVEVPGRHDATVAPAASETPREPEEAPVAEEKGAKAEVPDNFVPLDRPWRIAVVLPFMLDSKTPGKTAQRHSEFFRGFLLAVDSLAHRPGAHPVKVYAYDTHGSADSIRSLLRRKPEIAGMDIIIAPDTEAQLAPVADFGKANAIPVLNEFVVKDTAYLSNPWLMQANIPHDRMYGRAIEEMFRRFPGYTPVVVARRGGPDDRKTFVGELRKAAKADGREVKDIVFDDRLGESDLAKLAKTPLLFITMSGRQAEVNKILPALASYKERRQNPDDVVLMGYPEWIAFRGETLSNMQSVNTYVFSRFYNDAEDFMTRPVDHAYRRLYGTAMEQAVPRQGLMGFDTAFYVIQALGQGFGKGAYSGLQNGFDFTRAGDDNAGWVNNTLYLINFRPSGMIDRTLISR